MSKLYTLFHARFAGSTAILWVLRELGVAHELVELDYDDVVARKDSEPFRRMKKANPLLQFPTLILPDGAVMTEMAAILLYLAQEHGAGTLWDLNGLTKPQLAALYRFMVFVPGNIYPTITFQEFPERLISIPETENAERKAEVLEWIRARQEQRRGEAYELLERLIREFNEQTYGPDEGGKTTFLLGTAAPTILDLMMAVVGHYASHPRPAWIREKCPRLTRSAKRTISQSPHIEMLRQNDCTVILDGPSAS